MGWGLMGRLKEVGRMLGFVCVKVGLKEDMV